MANKIKGEVKHPSLGILVFDWDALAKIEGELGESALNLQHRLADLAVLFVFLRASVHSDVTDKFIKDNSRPLMDTIRLVRQALGTAYFGDAELAEIKADMEATIEADMEADVEAEKKARTHSG